MTGKEPPGRASKVDNESYTASKASPDSVRRSPPSTVYGVLALGPISHDWSRKRHTLLSVACGVPTCTSTVKTSQQSGRFRVKLDIWDCQTIDSVMHGHT